MGARLRLLRSDDAHHQSPPPKGSAGGVTAYCRREPKPRKHSSLRLSVGGPPGAVPAVSAVGEQPLLRRPVVGGIAVDGRRGMLGGEAEQGRVRVSAEQQLIGLEAEAGAAVGTGGVELDGGVAARVDVVGDVPVLRAELERVAAGNRRVADQLGAAGSQQREDLIAEVLRSERSAIRRVAAAGAGTTVGRNRGRPWPPPDFTRFQVTMALPSLQRLGLAAGDDERIARGQARVCTRPDSP